VVVDEDMAVHEDEDLEEDVATDASPMSGQSENAFTAQKNAIGQAIALRSKKPTNSKRRPMMGGRVRRPPLETTPQTKMPKTQQKCMPMQ